jgi:hypothetical protein
MSDISKIINRLDKQIELLQKCNTIVKIIRKNTNTETVDFESNIKYLKEKRDSLKKE